MDTTLDYLDIPSTATLLHSSKFQSAPKITTNLPSPCPPSSAPTSPTTENYPQFILAATLPTGIFPPSTPTSPSFSNAATPGSPPPLVSHPRNPPKSPKSNHPPPLLLSKDPLSLPTTSVNFRRFIACVGPAFWFQDRVEEIVLWKNGWKWTMLWVLLYGGLCRFPQLILCIPHVGLIAVILATYPYATLNDSTLLRSDSSPRQPAPTSLGRQRSSSQTPSSPSPTNTNINIPNTAAAAATPSTATTTTTTSYLASLPYQSNLQAIQNIMGIVSDLMDFAKPLVGHLILTPASLSTSPHSLSSPATSSNSPVLTAQPSSPYTIHILTLLVLTLPPLLVLVSLPCFPLRLAVFIAGAGPIFALHPWVKGELFPALVVLAVWAWNRPVPGPIINAYMRVVRFIRTLTHFAQRKDDDINGLRVSQKEDISLLSRTALKSLIERLIDNDRLSDTCWVSEMRQVELWENERYVGPLPPVVETSGGGGGGGQGQLGTKPSFSSFSSVGSYGSIKSLASFGTLKSLGSIASTGTRKGSWSKAHLRSPDRAGWTRRRDGWNGVDKTDSIGMTENSKAQDRQDVDEEYAGVDSRLTFPLAPGWSFVDSEDWRKDLSAEWAVGHYGDRVGMVDEDGWVYTNDVWMKGAPYVTRRRRWVRRVWFDPDKASEYRVPSSS